MEKIICESTYFYSSCEESVNTFRIKFRLKDTVDGKLLQQAAEQALKRYPYYSVRCVLSGQEYMLEPNCEPFIVVNTANPVELGGTVNNGYLLAVSYWQDTVWFNMFHGLADGCGTMRFARTALYYYCCERYDASLPSDGILINDRPIPQEEWDNPYIQIMNGERSLPNDEDVTVRLKTDGAAPALCLFDDPRITFSRRKHYQLRVSEKQVVQYCRTQDGTPGVVFSLLMSRAVDKLNPGNERPIISGIAINLRPALNAPMYKGSPLGIAPLSYGGKIKSKPFAQQATLFRGRLLLLSDYEHLLVGVNHSKRLYAAVDRIPTLEGKKQMMQGVLNSYRNASTFQVSYVGPANMGAVDRYIIEAEAENAGEGLTIEVMAVNGSFYLDIMQQWQEDLYFDAFCEELASLGFDYELLDCGELNIANVALP